MDYGTAEASFGIALLAVYNNASHNVHLLCTCNAANSNLYPVEICIQGTSIWKRIVLQNSWEFKVLWTKKFEGLNFILM